MSEEYQLSFHEISMQPKNSKGYKPNPIVLLLDRLEDARNLGAIFRLADAGRIAGIYGYHTQLEDKPKTQRVARQTTKHIHFEELTNMDQVQALSKDYHPIALEYTNKSISFKAYTSKVPCMLIIGNERRGISKELLNICQVSLHIPMLGQNSSMNVAVATGIVLYQLLDNMGKI